MKKLVVAVAFVMAVASASFAADGKALFQQKGCTACHQAAADTVGPSLKKIAAAYAGKEAELIKFLKGEGKAIVDPAKEAVMKPQINTTKAMKDDELKALAQFILSNK
ncbi:MAG: c-type cytochrome [Hydrogenothermaceae bacterium]|nr:c-type cytochrome [Hydrogenothermaceae bacterium]